MKTITMLVLLVTSMEAGAGAYSGMARPWLYGDHLYIDVGDTQMSDRPGCATRTLVRLQETDMNDPVFKAKFAVLLAAWMSGKPVSLSGTGQCTSEGDEIVFAISPSP